MKTLLAALSVLSMSSTAGAATLVEGWNATLSTVLNTYPQSTLVTIHSIKALEAKGVEFGGIRFKLARFSFDRTGHVSAVQLVADGDVATELKTNLSRADSPLWDPMSDNFVRVSEGGQGAEVMLCDDGAETTLTYARPPSATQPFTTIASNNILVGAPIG